MDLAHAEPKLIDNEYAGDKKLQTEKIIFEVHDHMIECIVFPNSAVLLLFHPLMCSKYPPKS